MLWKESFAQVRERVNAKLGHGKLLHLAQKTGIGVEHICKVWQGKRSLSFTSAYRVAKAADITLEDLYMTICAPPDSFCRKELKQAETNRKRQVAKVQYWQRREKQLAKIANQYKRTPTR